MKGGRIYYAHAIWLYGSSLEQKEIDLIGRIFPDWEIVNPSKLTRPERVGGLEFYKGQVERCDVVIFSRLAGKITAGVGLEVNHGLSRKKAVYEIGDRELIPVFKPVEFLSRQDTVALFLELDKRRCSEAD